MERNSASGPPAIRPITWPGGALKVGGHSEASSTPNRPAVHVAFRVPSRALVDAFHAAALTAGGRDNGAPGLRPHDHPDYYGAFVLDPDGHNIEAVCHAPPGQP